MWIWWVHLRQRQMHPTCLEGLQSVSMRMCWDLANFYNLFWPVWWRRWLRRWQRRVKLPAKNLLTDRVQGDEITNCYDGNDCSNHWFTEKSFLVVWDEFVAFNYFSKRWLRKISSAALAPASPPTGFATATLIVPMVKMRSTARGRWQIWRRWWKWWTVVEMTFKLLNWWFFGEHNDCEGLLQQWVSVSRPALLRAPGDRNFFTFTT